MNEDWEIIYYQVSARSSSPVQEFIESLEKRAKNKVIRTLELLENFGIKLGLPYAKKIAGTDLWELRILGQDNLRVFYVAIAGKSFLLLHGFSKKKQKTDKKELEIALARLKEYRSRQTN